MRSTIMYMVSNDTKGYGDGKSMLGNASRIVQGVEFSLINIVDMLYCVPASYCRSMGYPLSVNKPIACTPVSLGG